MESTHALLHTMVPHLELRGRPLHLAVFQDQCPLDCIVPGVNAEVALVPREGAHGQQELGDVVAVQGARLGGQPGRQVCVADADAPLQAINKRLMPQCLRQ